MPIPPVAVAAAAAGAVLLLVVTQDDRDAKQKHTAPPTPGEPPKNARLDALHPYVQLRAELALQEAHAAGYVVRVIETARSDARQLWLFEHGASKVKAGGYHPSLRGLDIVVLAAPDGDIDEYGEPDERELAALAAVAACFKRQGFQWGGDWKTFRDGYHMEMPYPGGHAAAYAALQADRNAYLLRQA